MRATATILAFTAFLSMCLAGPQRPRMVVSGTIGRVYGNSFTLRTGMGGAYTIQVTPQTVIGTSRAVGRPYRPATGIVPGAFAVVRGYPTGFDTIVAISITTHPRRTIVIKPLKRG